jgi:hypothetical protein
MSMALRIFVFMVLVGAMFWFIDLANEPAASPWARAGLIVSVAALCALQWIPRK